MNQEQFSLYLQASAGLACVIAFLNLVMVKKRGPRAIVMAAACLMLGGALLSFQQHAPMFVVVTMGLSVFVLLGADAKMRIDQRGKPR